MKKLRDKKQYRKPKNQRTNEQKKEPSDQGPHLRKTLILLGVHENKRRLQANLA